MDISSCQTYGSLSEGSWSNRPRVVVPRSDIKCSVMHLEHAGYVADAYTLDQVEYIWKHGYDSVKISKDVKLSQFDLQGHPISNYTSTQRRGAAFPARTSDCPKRSRIVAVFCSTNFQLSNKRQKIAFQTQNKALLRDNGRRIYPAFQAATRRCRWTSSCSDTWATSSSRSTCPAPSSSSSPGSTSGSTGRLPPTESVWVRAR